MLGSGVSNPQIDVEEQEELWVLDCKNPPVGIKGIMTWVDRPDPYFL